jgi:hypothetical protein
MRIYTLAITTALYLFSFSAVAGSGHDHSQGHAAITQAQAESIAIKNVAKLADKGKLDKGWTSVKPSKVEKKSFSGTPEWVIVFNNNDIADPEKRTLYIFLSIGGDYLAANHTGN